MKPAKWAEEAVPPHMREDVRTRNQNIDAGHELCDWCDGTGNELFSMYRRCPKCNGTGILSNVQCERSAK